MINEVQIVYAPDDSIKTERVKLATEEFINVHIGKVNIENSSSSVLVADEVFTGDTVSILDYSLILVNVHADVESADDGLSIQQSSDGTNWDHTDEYTIPVNGNKNFSVQRLAKYFRIVYTNGTTAQTSFRLQTILSGNTKPSSHRIKDAIIGDDDAELVKAAITGVDKLGAWHNVEVTPDANLAISDNSSGSAIAEGLVTGKSAVQKFGKAHLFDIANNHVHIWDGADSNTIGQMNYIYSTTANINTISSSSTSDTQDIEIQGLDSNYNLVVQTATLNGQNKVTLTTSLIRIFRMKNKGSVDGVGNVFCFVDTTIVSGVPSDTTKVRAMIKNDGSRPNNQTQMALYTIPAGMTGYAELIDSSMAGARKSSVHNIRLEIREFGGVFQLKNDFSIIATGTSDKTKKYRIPITINEKSDIQLLVNTDENDAAVSGGFDVVLKNN